MHPAAMKHWASVLGLFALSLVPAHAKYGDTLEVRGDSSIPAGWIVMSARTAPRMGTGPLPPLGRSQYTLTIMDIRDAPEGTKLKIPADHEVPQGWVVLSSPQGFRVGPPTKEIQCLVGPESKATPAPSAVSTRTVSTASALSTPVASATSTTSATCSVESKEKAPCGAKASPSPEHLLRDKERLIKALFGAGKPAR